ncbi:MAG: glucokinase [Sphingomicrobium sp.]
MFGPSTKSVSKVALVADVGRTKVRVALTNAAGRLDHNSVREYDPSAQPTISTAITAFGVESGLAALPRRAAIAVSGVPRGDTISITNSRWILSRQGLTAMFQASPLILNDFAANAWAMSAEHIGSHMEGLTSAAVVKPQNVGTYCIIGIGSGLGVAMMSRDEHGFVNVLPTEGGHMGIMDGLPGLAPVLDKMRRGNAPVTAEMLVSGPGLLAIYEALCAIKGRSSGGKTLHDLLAPTMMRGDPVIAEALELFTKTFWHFAGNMVLGYGAWDGLILTGSITAALRPMLRRTDLNRHFMLEGPYARRLRDVPTATASFKHAELEGAAVALLVNDARRSAADRGLAAAA